MLTVVIVLACSAVAFVCGGMLGKAYSATRNTVEPVGREKLHALLQAQRDRYRRRMIALNNVIRRHEETRDQIRETLAGIETGYAERGQALEATRAQLEAEQQQNGKLRVQLERLETGQQNAAAIEKEFGMLRIERDELAARLARLEADIERTRQETVQQEENQTTKMRAIMGDLRESLATRDRRIHDLELQLADSTERVRELQTKLEDWKQRVTPLTKQLRRQKELVRQLRQVVTMHVNGSEQTDDLQAIQGIGPDLERRLHKFGIRQYRQLARMTGEELASISQKLAIAPDIPERDAWIEQARNLCQQNSVHEPA